MRGDHRDHDPAFWRFTRDVARPVTEERTEGNRVAHGYQRCADERRPETGLTHGDSACILAVERRGKSEDAQQEQQTGRPHRDAVDPQHEAETVDAYRQHQQREQTVGQAQGQVGFRQIDQALGAAHQCITRTPDGEREERDSGQQRQERTDDSPVHAEVRTGRNGVVGAVDRSEQAHRRQDQRAEYHAQHNRPDTSLKGQAEQHRETAEHGGGKGVGAAEDQAKQIAGLGVTLIVRDLFDPVCFDAAKAFFVVFVIHDQLRS
ncbi:hypothetical protein D3C87_985420 [compost metagenome]